MPPLVIPINKVRGEWVHCSQNKIKIKGSLFCLICICNTRGKVKRFDNCKSLFYHYTHNHRTHDENRHIENFHPSLKYCLSQLQEISEAIQFGVLK